MAVRRDVTRSLLALQRTALQCRKKWIDWTGRSGQIYFPHRVAEYREMWRSASEELGGTFTALARDLWEIEVGSVRTRVNNHQTEFDNPVVLNLAGRKAVVHRLLGAAGLRVPEHLVFSLEELSAAYRFLGDHPWGCVVKPGNGHGGQGVTTHVQTIAELRRAALLASLYDEELLVEAQIPGESYRLLILEGTLVHAVCRRGPRLRGDGVSTIQRLIESDNARDSQSARPALDVDRDCLFTLGAQGFSLDSIPGEGTEFPVKTVNDPARKYVEVRTVYSETVTDLICDSVREDAEAAACLVGSDFLGVDLITPDCSVPLQQSGGVINEVNTTPALHHHYDSTRESHPDAAVRALRALLARKTTWVGSGGRDA